MTKFRKEQNKKLNIKDGFYDPLTWIDTGNFALNKMMSGNFRGGVPIGSATTFAGASGSGKSYIVSANVVRNALTEGVAVVLLDSEGAVKKKWAEALGVPTEHPNLIRWPKTTINQVAKTISDFMEDYTADVAKMAREDQPPVLFVLDSLGNLLTETNIEQFKDGDLKGDKGLFAKQVKALFKSTMGMFEGYQAGLVCTNHTYTNQNQYSDHEDIISGGGGQIYLSDIVMSMNKAKLKLDSEGNKTTTVQGIRSTIKCVKSRYAKPFEEVEVHIPYDRGMDPYSGLFEMIKEKVLVKDGNYYIYSSKETGKEHKLFRKHMDGEFFEMVMREYNDADEPVGVNEVPEGADVE
jgi:RecA/RadA recombinase